MFDCFLCSPTTVALGTTMRYDGVTHDGERDDLIV